MMNRQARISTPYSKAPAWGILLISLVLFMAGCEPTPQASTVRPTSTLEERTPIPATATSTPSSTPKPPTPTPTISCTDQTGQVEPGNLPAKNLYQSRIDFRVYTPACYEAKSEQRYPVLYLFHGLYFEDDQWEHIGAVEVADQLIARGEIPPFLMVFPYDPTYREPSEYGFDEAVLELLVPYIDETYRTIPERTFRAAGGLSRGGGWAIHFAFTRPDLFGAVGGHSPIVLYDDGTDLPGLLNKIPDAKMPRIYLDIGENDSEIFSVTWFDELLNDMGIPHEYHIYPGQHTEAYWSEHVEEYIRWYAAGWEQ